MRQLLKTDIPQILEKNSAKWTNVILSALDKGEKPTSYQKSKYNHKDIKEALLGETFEKCAYCESKFKHVTYGDIEHIIPKSIVPNKAFDWSNLTLACDVCNTNKGDWYADDNHEGIVDPYLDDPKDHLLFFREVVVENPCSDKGLITVRKLKLGRIALLEKRRERLGFIDGLVRSYHGTKNIEAKAIIRADIYNHISSDKEYAAIASEYVQSLVDRGLL